MLLKKRFKSNNRLLNHWLILNGADTASRIVQWFPWWVIYIWYFQICFFDFVSVNNIWITMNLFSGSQWGLMFSLLCSPFRYYALGSLLLMYYLGLSVPKCTFEAFRSRRKKRHSRCNHVVLAILLRQMWHRVQKKCEEGSGLAMGSYQERMVLPCMHERGHKRRPKRI